jgi:hypothetical protein
LPGPERRVSQYANADELEKIVCRVCWAHIPLPTAGEVEVGEDGRPFLRCTECGGSFLVREQDAEGPDAPDGDAATDR